MLACSRPTIGPTAKHWPLWFTSVRTGGKRAKECLLMGMSQSKLRLTTRKFDLSPAALIEVYPVELLSRIASLRLGTCAVV